MPEDFGTEVPMPDGKRRLAIVVSHPIQYYVPLYRRLASRADLDVKVFFTWHTGETAHHDPGFGRKVAWDIPLTQGYCHELVENKSSRPGSDHFWGIRNPQLVSRILGWKPDAVHITGYAYASHVHAMRALHRRGLPVLFRGDSHLLDHQGGVFLSIKKELLRHVYSWTTCCLYVGRNNYEYFRALGLPEEKLFYCPHSIEVQRFAEPHDQLERQAQHWRKTLQISEQSNVLLFAGKFEARKQPIELMKTIAALPNDNIVLLMIGNGPLEGEVSSIAKRFPARFRLLPFQNQSKMPLVYRLGDLFVLPSIRGETWGLAVNEAIASGRRVLISDKVGCAPDLVMSNTEGAVFAAGDWRDFTEKLAAQLSQPMNSQHLRSFSRRFDLPETERKLCAALDHILPAAGSAKTYRDNLRHSLP